MGSRFSLAEHLADFRLTSAPDTAMGSRFSLAEHLAEHLADDGKRFDALDVVC